MAAAGPAGAARGGGAGGIRNAPKGLRIVGAGAGGVAEMREHVDDTTVQFGLVRFTFGSGSFKRNKLLFVTVLGENAPAVKKGRLLTKKNDVKDACGTSHAELQIENKDECTVETFVDTLKDVIVVDNMGDFSIAKMKADYEAMIRAAGADGGGRDILLRAKGRKTAAEMGSVECSRAVSAVKERMGPFNWVLVKPKVPLELHNAGSMSVTEMHKWLAEDEVLYGLLRMGFGTGQFRRVKWICLHWSGERVSPVKRGQANAKKNDIQKQLEPYNVVVNASTPDECTLESIIDKVRRAAILDGGGEDHDENAFSIEEFMKALREEAAAHADFFGDGDAEVTHDFRDTLTQIRNDPTGFNWVLMQFDK